MVGAATGAHTNIGGFEGMLKCQQFVNDATKSPNIALRVVRLNALQFQQQGT